MEPGFHRAERPVEPLGDGVERQIGPEAKDDDDPLVGRQPREAGEQRVTLEEGLKGVASGRVDTGVHRDEADDVPAAQPVAAAVDQDPVEPGSEFVRLAERPERLPGDDERVLDRVLGFGGVGEQQAGQSIGAIERRAGRGDEAGAARDVGLGPGISAGRASIGTVNSRMSPFQTSDERERFSGEAGPPAPSLSRA